MFGEDVSESPRRPSPWLPSPGPSTPLISLDDGSSKPELQATNWPDELEPELDELGNIEYKLKILTPTPSRFEKLTTQLKWRLLEGGGTALYELGVLDDGTLVGLTRREMDESLSNLARMARALDCQLELVRVIEIPEIFVNAGPASSKIPPSIRVPGGFDRKERARQKKKKKKCRAKPVVVLPSKGKTRIEPGDAAVSSASEPPSPRGVSPDEQPAVVVLASCQSSRASISSLCPAIEGSTRSLRRPRLNSRSDFLDQMSLLTPEERSVLRRARKSERRAAMAAEARRAKAQAEQSATSSSPWPDLKDEDLGGWKRGDEDNGGTKYVVEVCVAKEIHAEEERFLDFEGFGISDSP